MFFHNIQDTCYGIVLIVLLEVEIHSSTILLETVDPEDYIAGSLSTWHLGKTLVDGNNNLRGHGGTMEGK